MMLRNALICSGLAIAAVACGGVEPHSKEAGAVSQFPLAVHPVSWNPAHAAVGKVRAVADDRDVVAVFGDQGVTVFRSGAVAGHEPTAHDWVGAAVVPAVDGTSDWIVGFDRKGRLYSLRGLSTFDDVSDRYGLGSVAVRSIAIVDAGNGTSVVHSTSPGSASTKPLVGFALDGELAIADGSQLTKYATVTLGGLSGGGSIAAGVAVTGIEVVDARARTAMLFDLDGAKYVAVTTDGKVYAATARAIYARDGQKLSLLYEANGDTIHGLVASGTRVWFADGETLGAIEAGRVAEATTKSITNDATLSPSPSGDVWAIAGGNLERFARTETPNGGAKPTPAIVWQSQIQPVFARACASCHLPGGVSGTDLSTPGDWAKEKSAIHERVVVQKSMPPAGHGITDADRDAIRAWTEEAQP